MYRIFSSQPYMAIPYIVALVKLSVCGDPSPSNTSKTGILLLFRQHEPTSTVYTRNSLQRR